MTRLALGIFGAIGIIVAIGFLMLALNRPAAQFAEETRRVVYEESVTARTACQAELLRLYTESLDESLSVGRRRALELQALNEYDRSRCDGLRPEVVNWMEAIPR